MTDTSTTVPGPEAPPAGADRAGRRLRRSRTQRVGAGVAGGLGEYFGVDPVLFRVLFATSAFFGGAGILAYLLAWAVIPDASTSSAAIDRWTAELRRRHVPPWLILVVTGLVVWAVAFSWWAPGPFVPVVAIVVLLVVVFGRRDFQAPTPAAPVDLTQPGPEAPTPPGAATAPDLPAEPPWLRESRLWLAEARARRRERRRRSLPVRLATLGVLGVTLIVTAVVDSVDGVPMHAYFWLTLGVVVAGLLVGAVLRRTPWSVAWLLPVAVAGVVAFGSTAARFGDGTGSVQWRPTTAPATHYRLAFGDGELDLRRLAPQTGPRTVQVRVAAGRVRIVAPATLNLTVHAHIGTAGRVETVPGSVLHDGLAFDRTIDPPTGATGTPLTVDVSVADGQITVIR